MHQCAHQLRHVLHHLSHGDGRMSLWKEGRKRRALGLWNRSVSPHPSRARVAAGADGAGDCAHDAPSDATGDEVTDGDADVVLPPARVLTGTPAAVHSFRQHTPGTRRVMFRAKLAWAGRSTIEAYDSTDEQSVSEESDVLTERHPLSTRAARVDLLSPQDVGGSSTPAHPPPSVEASVQEWCLRQVTLRVGYALVCVMV